MRDIVLKVKMRLPTKQISSVKALTTAVYPIQGENQRQPSLWPPKAVASRPDEMPRTSRAGYGDRFRDGWPCRKTLGGMAYLQQNPPLAGYRTVSLGRRALEVGVRCKQLATHRNLRRVSAMR